MPSVLEGKSPLFFVIFLISALFINPLDVPISLLPCLHIVQAVKTLSM